MPRKGEPLPPRVLPGDVENPNTIQSRKRRERERRQAAREARARRQLALSVNDAIARYRTEKAMAMERWAEQGGPSCGLTSGRHPICWSQGPGALR